MAIEALQQQVDELAWLNSCNESNYAEMLKKYQRKKKKVKDERLKQKIDIQDVEKRYEAYIQKLQRVLKRDHNNYQNQIEYMEMQIDVSNAQVDILKNRIDKYLEVAKQAKSVLRVPRLCNMYHNKIKGLSDTEAN